MHVFERVPRKDFLHAPVGQLIERLVQISDDINGGQGNSIDAKVPFLPAQPATEVDTEPVTGLNGLPNSRINDAHRLPTPMDDTGRPPIIGNGIANKVICCNDMGGPQV